MNVGLKARLTQVFELASAFNAFEYEGHSETMDYSSSRENSSDEHSRFGVSALSCKSREMPLQEAIEALNNLSFRVHTALYKHREPQMSPFVSFIPPKLAACRENIARTRQSSVSL